MNTCVFSGNLCKDAEVKDNGQSTTTNFSLAVQTGFGESKSAMFINCSAYNKEKIAPYMKKGMKITVSGELSERESNGKRYLNLRVRDIDLPPRPSGNIAPQEQAPAPAKDDRPEWF